MFLSPELLQNHIDFRHRNIPTHICDICGVGCKSINALKGHQKKHSEIKTVQQCDVCGLYFVDMQAHRSRAHSVSLVPCEKCGKELSPRYVKRHMDTVHGEGPDRKIFTCHVCDREFTSKDKMKVHLDIHLGIRYPCHFCAETYGASSNRLKHMQRKHPVEYENFKIHKNLDKVAKYGIAGNDQSATENASQSAVVEIVVTMEDNQVIIEDVSTSILSQQEQQQHQ